MPKPAGAPPARTTEPGVCRVSLRGFDRARPTCEFAGHGAADDRHDDDRVDSSRAVRIRTPGGSVCILDGVGRGVTDDFSGDLAYLAILELRLLDQHGECGVG